MVSPEGIIRKKIEFEVESFFCGLFGWWGPRYERVASKTTDLFYTVAGQFISSRTTNDELNYFEWGTATDIVRRSESGRAQSLASASQQLAGRPNRNTNLVVLTVA